MGTKKLLSEERPEDQFFNLAGWVKYYGEHSKLPHNRITCSECRQTATSMFGNNLRNSLPKFGNDIEALLRGFVCRPCRTMKTENEKLKKPKEEKQPKKKEVAVLSLEELEDRKEEIRQGIPKIDFDKKPVPITPDSKEQVQHITASACLRPDIFLDNGRYCNGCPWIKNCICRLKRISEKEIVLPRKRK